MSRNGLLIMLSLLAILAAFGQPEAGWVEDGVPISVTNGYKYSPKIIPDGEGGAIVAWYQAIGSYNIYVQKVDGHGNVKWTVGGLGVCTDPGSQQSPNLVSDGAGGAIVTWMDYRVADYDIYAQRIDSGGNILWTADGVPVCEEAGDQLYPQITTDGAGGAIIAWHDGRGGSVDIFVQRIDGNGNEVWFVGGINICWTSGEQHYPVTVTDEAGGAIVVWEDVSAGDGTSKLYAQRVNSSGVTQWTDLGEFVASRIFSSSNIKVIPDGASGLIVAWHDYISPSYEVFAQRVSSEGTRMWGDGVDLTGADPGVQQNPVLVSDGTKGAIIAWRDTRNGDGD
ncbi:MAG TPA: hypothetical protein VLA34_05675, partial [Candidatus Krumholzibacterium sp.]|nr:hypothetical protein [Candidatus Krumholzibacterium sp.]